MRGVHLCGDLAVNVPVWCARQCSLQCLICLCCSCLSVCILVVVDVCAKLCACLALSACLLQYAMAALSYNEMSAPRWSAPVTLVVGGVPTTHSMGEWVLINGGQPLEAYW